MVFLSAAFLDFSLVSSDFRMISEIWNTAQISNIGRAYPETRESLHKVSLAHILVNYDRK